MIRLPPREEVAFRWGEVCALLQRATRHTSGCYEPEDVLREIMRGECAIWFIERDELIHSSTTNLVEKSYMVSEPDHLRPRLVAVAVTVEHEMPRKRLFVIRFVAGRSLAAWWPEFVERMDEAARRAGCDQITAYGRPGWVRFWKARGVAVHVASEIMVRDLKAI